MEEKVLKFDCHPEVRYGLTWLPKSKIKIGLKLHRYTFILIFPPGSGRARHDASF